MNKHSLVADWISFTEQMGSLMPIARDGFQLMPYLPCISAVVYTHLAVPSSRKFRIEWPRK